MGRPTRSLQTHKYGLHMEKDKPRKVQERHTNLDSIVRHQKKVILDWVRDQRVDDGTRGNIQTAADLIRK